jgi:hypothetical protein
MTMHLVIKDEKTGKDVELEIDAGVPFEVVYRGIVRSGVAIDKQKFRKLIELAAPPAASSTH